MGVDELKTRNHENYGLGRRLLARDCNLSFAIVIAFNSISLCDSSSCARRVSR